MKKGFSPVVPLRICGAVLGFLFPFLVYLGIRKDATLTVTLLILGMAVIHFAGIAGKPEKHQRYYEYKLEKEAKRGKPKPRTLILGLVFLALSGLCLILYNGAGGA